MNDLWSPVAPSSHLGGSSLSLSSRLSPEEARLVQFLRQNAQVATSEFMIFIIGIQGIIDLTERFE